MKSKDIFSMLIKNEIDISVEIAQHWSKYQTLSVKEGYENIAKIQFMDCAKIAINKSLFTMEDHYLEWLEEQFENKLPNASSGSTMTALLDMDGTFSIFEDALYEINDDICSELYDEMIKYQNTLLGNLRVERGIDLH
tara:strand:+ start:303 stop:716 length:414 start_codon:yes stop_codon:yes gene_type:complete